MHAFFNANLFAKIIVLLFLETGISARFNPINLHLLFTIIKFTLHSNMKKYYLAWNLGISCLPWYFEKFTLFFSKKITQTVYSILTYYHQCFGWENHMADHFRLYKYTIKTIFTNMCVMCMRIILKRDCRCHCIGSQSNTFDILLIYDIMYKNISIWLPMCYIVCKLKVKIKTIYVNI